jgi:hypothetical protein
MQAEPSPRQSWPYFRTPIGAFLVVMLPINSLMAILLTVASTPVWMKVTSALVISISLINLVRGYYRRLVFDECGAVFISLFGRVTIPWDCAKTVGVYSPYGGRGGVEYAFVTRHDRQPKGVWENDQDTIQIQNRDGLLNAIRSAQEKSKPEAVERVH